MSQPTPNVDSAVAGEPSTSTSTSTSHITEDEASLYDRQIRLWGLEAQNRMRGSTVLVLGLRGVAHETIKNLVLAGIGRLIVMDDGDVTEEDLGSGFLFREEEGAVGVERTTAASPQIASLNPLVSLTCIPTLAPFVRNRSTSSAIIDSNEAMKTFLKREKVDVLVACDLTTQQNESIDIAARAAGTIFYASSTYGYYGYVFADLGESYEYVYMPAKTTLNPNPALTKKTLSFSTLTAALDSSNWHLPNTSKTPSRSPYRDLTRQGTANRVIYPTLEVLALWRFETQHHRLPRASEDDNKDPEQSTSSHRKRRRTVPPPIEDSKLFSGIHKQLSQELGINMKAHRDLSGGLAKHFRYSGEIIRHANTFFPPTLAIVGGLLAQDVLRALSRKDQPITNLLVVNSMETSAVVERWAMAADA